MTHRLNPRLPTAWRRIAVMGILTTCISTTASARTSMEEDKTCPYDGVKFHFVGQGSGTSTGQQLDLMPVGMITSPWPMAVCPTNGFVFYKSTFDDAELEKLKPLILSPEYQSTKDDTSYYRAFWILDRSGGSHVDATEMLLKATWQTGGESYARYATILLERLSKDIANSEGKVRWKYISLQGEILRRLGRFEEVARHFKRWQSELPPANIYGVIASYELQLSARRDTDPHLISEAIELADRDRDMWLARRAPEAVGGALTRTNAFEFSTLRTAPNIQWSLDGKSIVGTEATPIPGSWMREDSRLVKFDLASRTRTIIKESIQWRVLGRSRDNKTLMALQSGGQEWHFLQVDSATLEVLRAVPTRAWTWAFALSHDGRSVLMQDKQGLAAFDFGADGLRRLLSPSFVDWDVRAADPTGPRIAITVDDDRSIFVWDYEKGAIGPKIRPASWPDKYATADMLFTADGSQLIIATHLFSKDDNSTKVTPATEVTVWDVQAGTQISRQFLDGASACNIAANKERRLFAVGCWNGVYLADQDHLDHFIEVLRAPEGFELDEFSFSPDSTGLAMRTMDALFVYSIHR